jgi:hypothetical protein
MTFMTFMSKALVLGLEAPPVRPIPLAAR